MSWLLPVSRRAPSRTTIAYDSTGRVVSLTTPGIGGSTAAEAVTRFAYPDAPKTLVAGANTDPAAAVATALHTTYTFTASGQRVSAVTDADGRKKSKTYTPQMSTASATAGEGASASTSTFQYGANSGASMTSATGPCGCAAGLGAAAHRPGSGPADERSRVGTTTCPRCADPADAPARASGDGSAGLTTSDPDAGPRSWR